MSRGPNKTHIFTQNVCFIARREQATTTAFSNSDKVSVLLARLIFFLIRSLGDRHVCRLDWLQVGCFVGVSTPEVTADSTVFRDRIETVMSLVPWFPFELDSSTAGWLRGGGKTTQTSWD